MGTGTKTTGKCLHESLPLSRVPKGSTDLGHSKLLYSDGWGRGGVISRDKLTEGLLPEMNDSSYSHPQVKESESRNSFFSYRIIT